MANETQGSGLFLVFALSLYTLLLLPYTIYHFFCRTSEEEAVVVPWQKVGACSVQRAGRLGSLRAARGAPHGPHGDHALAAPAQDKKKRPLVDWLKKMGTKGACARVPA